MYSVFFSAAAWSSMPLAAAGRPVSREKLCASKAQSLCFSLELPELSRREYMFALELPYAVPVAITVQGSCSYRVHTRASVCTYGCERVCVCGAATQLVLPSRRDASFSKTCCLVHAKPYVSKLGLAACSGLLWIARHCSGLLWAARGCSGCSGPRCPNILSYLCVEMRATSGI